MTAAAMVPRSTSRRVAWAVCALCSVLPGVLGELDMAELMRNAGEGELNLDELMRQAGIDAGAMDAAPAAADDDVVDDASRYAEPRAARPSARAGGSHANSRGYASHVTPEEPELSAYGDEYDLEPPELEPEAVDDAEDEVGTGSSNGGSFALRLDKSTLSVLRRWANFANGVLLLLLGPVTLAISAAALSFDKMVLAVYVSLFGLVLSAQELRVEPVTSWLRQNFQFMQSHRGRAAFMLFSGNLLWSFGRVGVVPAVLTCANSAFNAKFTAILARLD